MILSATDFGRRGMRACPYPREAFRKIVKKHDKVTGWQTQETYMLGLRDLRMFHDNEVRELRAAMEDTYLQIEEVLCLLDPDRWRRAAGRNAAGGAGSGSGSDGWVSRSAGSAGGDRRGSTFTPGFYEVRRRRNELLGKLRQDTRGPGNGIGRRSGPQFLAGLAFGAAFALGAMLVTRLVEVGSSDCKSTERLKQNRFEFFLFFFFIKDAVVMKNTNAAESSMP